MRDVGVLRGNLAQCARLRSGRESVALRQSADISETRIARDRLRALPDELHAVVILGIMAGRDGDAAAHTQMRRGEVNFFCAAQADVLHRDALLAEPFNQGRLDGFTGESNIVSHDDGARLNYLGVGTTDTAGDIFIQLIGNAAPHIVGFEAIQRHRHSSLP